MRNPYKHIGSEPIIATNRGNPEYFVSAKLDNQANFQASISSLMSAGASLGFDAPKLDQPAAIINTNGHNQITSITGLKNEKDHQH